MLFTRAVVPPQGEARSRDRHRRAAARQDGRSGRPLARHLLPWRSQREFNTYLLGDSGIRIEDLERTGYHQVQRRAGPATAGRSRRRPARSSSSRPPWQTLGLDPLPAYDAAEPRARCPRSAARRYPLILVTGDREKSYHHSRFRDQPWALKVSPDPRLTMHPDTARALGLDDGAWVQLEVARGKGTCRLRIKLSDATPPDVVNTGMGWWLPSDPAPEHGALDVNINAALAYDGPWDPVSGSSDIRGLPCRVVPVAGCESLQLLHSLGFDAPPKHPARLELSRPIALPPRGDSPLTGRKRKMKVIAGFVVAASMFGLSLAAQAQVPQYGPDINLEQAKAAMAAAQAEAKKNNWPVAVAVVGNHGFLVAFEKIDNTQSGSVQVAIDKAVSAAIFRRPTKAFQDVVAGGGAGLRILNLRGASTVEGGLPIAVGGKIIGAVGVSGVAADQDGMVAKAGADAVK